MRFLFSIEKSVGSVIFRKNENGGKEFLLLHYPNGHWDFVKGHTEIGETEQSTLLREMAEETGITQISVLPKFKDNIRYCYRARGGEAVQRKQDRRSCNVAKKVVYYLAETKQEAVVLSSEHTEYAWLPYEQALARITYAGAKKIFRKAGDFMKKHHI